MNPIRAAMAETPEESHFTGASDRIEDIKSIEKSRRKRRKKKSQKPTRSKRWERTKDLVRSGWLSPIEIDEQNDPLGADSDQSGRRASQKGFLAISLIRYLELLDWTGRQIKSGKKGRIPRDLKPILHRLGITEKSWRRLVAKFGMLFKRAAGNTHSLNLEAKRRGQNYLHAPGAKLLCHFS